MRRRARPKSAGSTHLTAATAAALPDLPAIGNPSIARGPWPVDAVRAQADARRVLNSIDFSKRDLVIWVPDSGTHGLNTRFADVVHDSWSGGGASLTHLEYEGSWNLRQSVATGIATLKLVLAEIHRRGGDHRVLLAGAGQGAWVLAEALADASLRGQFDRAVLFGTPGFAAHRYEDGHDPRVRAITDPNDVFARPVSGDASRVLDAFIAARQKKWYHVLTLAGGFRADPQLGAEMFGIALHDIPLVGHLVRNPADYTNRYSEAVDWLHG